ncbi:MAG: SGNH/GDSL hydrolase family protein [Kiritimatiellia bacterium]
MHKQPGNRGDGPPRVRRKIRWIPRVLLAASGPFLVCLLLETGLRIHHPAHASLDPASAWDRSPVFFEYPVSQSPEPISPAPGTLRISVVGDSFAQGAGVQADDRYASRLQRALNTHPHLPPVQVDCYAMAGTSTYQQLPLLRQALATHPVLVILGVCLNDTEDWTRPDQLKVWRSRWLPPEPGALMAWLSRHSRLAGLLQDKIAGIRMQKGYLKYFRDIYRTDYSGWRRFEAAVPRFKQECDACGIPMIALVFPLLADPFDQGRYPYESQHEAIRKVMQDSGVPCLDLLEKFRGKDPVRMAVIPTIDPHPSEIAHRIAVDALIPFLIKDQALLSAAYLPEASKQGAKWHQMWQRTLARTHPGAALPPAP